MVGVVPVEDGHRRLALSRAGGAGDDDEAAGGFGERRDQVVRQAEAGQRGDVRRRDAHHQRELARAMHEQAVAQRMAAAAVEPDVDGALAREHGLDARVPVVLNRLLVAVGRRDVQARGAVDVAGEVGDDVFARDDETAGSPRTADARAGCREPTWRG